MFEVRIYQGDLLQHTIEADAVDESELVNMANVIVGEDLWDRIEVQHTMSRKLHELLQQQH